MDDKATIIAATVAKVVALNEAELAAVKAALNTRTGRLRANPPADDMACAAWMGLQPNPHKIRVWRAIMLPNEAKTLMFKLSQHHWPVQLDMDADELNKLGVW